MNALTLRLKSTGAARRAGFDLTPLGHWAVHALEIAAVEGLRRLLALVLDPKIEVQVGTTDHAGGDGDGYHWEPAPSAEVIKARIASVEPVVLVLDASPVEAALREMVEAHILAIREGRCPMPPIDEIHETTAAIRSAKPSDFGRGLMIDPDQAELDLTGAWIKDLGEEGLGLGVDVILPGDTGETDTRGPVSPPTEGEATPDTATPKALPSDAEQNAGTDTPTIPSQPGEAEGQAQVATLDPAPAPVPAPAPAQTETVVKPAKAKSQTKPGPKG
ncbi:hypothetical protein ABI_08640 [Asticcacaulis biprosthecium C19]|uniref:Uncharacterized protein n=1 Tax=Asticcacaulis biprosthecium C19 TaxID=715226 RepID=F4QGA0_9CAUL|nr:hypothetical protein [Asticcacaulis biprosthecium]EGF92428.1 hypothetical protein ABI_08640 [Asticcacaulis biprosthecium C19]